MSVVNGTRRVFEDLGCVVEEAEPDFTGVAEAFPALRFTGNHPQYSALIKQRAEWVKDTIKYEVAEAEKLTAADVGRAQARQAQLYAQSREFFERYEYFVLPVTQVVPFDVNTPYPTAVAGVAMAICVIAGVAGTRWHQRPWADAAVLRDRVLADVMRLGDEMRCTAAETEVADLPDATNGAYVFRNGFREALTATLPVTPTLLQSNAPGTSPRCRFRWTDRGLVAQRVDKPLPLRHLERSHVFDGQRWHGVWRSSFRLLL